MKTLDEIKEEYAKEWGYLHWNDLFEEEKHWRSFGYTLDEINKRHKNQ